MSLPSVLSRGRDRNIMYVVVLSSMRSEEGIIAFSGDEVLDLSKYNGLERIKDALDSSC